MNTIYAAIALYYGPRMETDVRVHEDGPHEGQIDEGHVSKLVEHLQTLAGHAIPIDAVYLEPSDRSPWQFSIIDAKSEAREAIGVLTVYTGAGA